MKKIILLIGFVFIGLTSCKNDVKNSETANLESYRCPMHCEGGKTYNKPGDCPVCEMPLALVTPKIKKEVSLNEMSDMSIFHLSSIWTNQNGEDLYMKDLKGNVLVMVMIYTSCKAACPRLVADMRNIEERLPDAIKDKVTMVFVSIDPKTDTPERLKAYAKENLMDKKPWVFLRSSEENTREFAAVLAVSYKEISPIDFSHSNIISVFNHKGEMVFQQEGLGVNSDNTIKHINEAVENM